jgi:multidrug resistance efflux pump
MRQMTHLPTWSSSIIIIVSVICSAAPQQVDNRAPLESEFQQRAELARQHLASITEQLQRKERDFSLGVAPNIEVLEAQVNVAKAQAQLRLAELHLEEVRVTGRDPLSKLSSPLVSGRDFVGEGLQIEMSVPQAVLELEQFRLRDTKKSVEVGTVSPIALVVSRSRIVEVEAAIESFRKKTEIRQSFLDRSIDGPEVELRVLEVEAEQRQKTLISKVELAREELERTRKMVDAGLAESILVAEADLRLQKLEADLAKVELDLALARRQQKMLQIGR